MTARGRVGLDLGATLAELLDPIRQTAASLTGCLLDRPDQGMPSSLWVWMLRRQRGWAMQ